MKSLVVEKEKLINNIKKIKEYAKKNNENTKIIAAIKCNGYGIGSAELAKILIEEEINFFAISTVEEAIELRNAGIENDILMLSSTAIKEDLEILIDNNIILTVGSIEDVEQIEKIAQEKNIKVRAHLKIDTGMGRYGFLYNQKDVIINTIRQLKNISIEGIFSHFSNSFYDDKYTNLQFERFISVIDELEKNNIKIQIKHICNSSAFVKYPNMYLDAVRLGSAFLGRLSCYNSLNLDKVGYLETQVSEIRELEKNSYIGYSNAYKTKKNTKVAIIPCGYSEGFNITTNKDMFRKIDKIRYVVGSIKDLFKKSRITIEINDQKCPVLGRVGTHHIVCDITSKNIKIGDIVKLQVNPKYVDSSINRKFI